MPFQVFFCTINQPTTFGGQKCNNKLELTNGNYLKFILFKLCSPKDILWTNKNRGKKLRKENWV